MKTYNPTKGTKHEQNVKVVEFGSIREFYDYITETPTNEHFEYKYLESKTHDAYFTGTESFEQAADFLLHGWKIGAEKLAKSARKIESSGTVEKMRPQRSVAGFQAVVPAYLNGDPRAMISTQRKPVKQPVVNVMKMIAYRGDVSGNRIFEESVKALQIVRQLEASGQRVNLWVVRAHSAGGKTILCRVKVKGANERLNLSKIAFPMCSPSMQRRMMFRFTEVSPETTQSFSSGYGSPLGKYEVVKIMEHAKTEEIVLPTFFKRDFDISKIRTVEDLKNL